MIADRIYATLKDAQDYVNDLSTTASAIPGLVLSVVNDGKNNGIYYVQSIAQAKNGEKVFTEGVSTPGVLIPAGAGAGSEAVDTYADAVAGATEDNLGQVFYVKKTTYKKGTGYTETESQADKDAQGNIVAKYESGPYIVTGNKTVAKLGVTSASGNLASDVEVIKGKVSTNESEIAKIKSAIEGGVHFAGVIASSTGVPVYDEDLNNTQGTNNYYCWEQDGDPRSEQFDIGDIIIVVDQTSPELTEPTKEYILVQDPNSEHASWVELGTCSISDQKIAELEGAFNSHVTNMNTLLAPTIAAADDYVANKANFATTASLNDYVKKNGTKVLSEKDFTADYETKLKNIEANAQKNVIEKVQVNGTDLTISNKTVNVDITGTIVSTVKVNGASPTNSNGKAEFTIDANDIVIMSAMEGFEEGESSVDEVLGHTLELANTKIARIHLADDSATKNVLGLSKTTKDNDTIQFKIASGSSLTATNNGLDLVWTEL